MEKRPYHFKPFVRISARAVISDCILVVIMALLLVAAGKRPWVMTARFSEAEPAFFMPDEAFAQTGDVQNPYADLSVPTFVTKYDDIYFIVDCYHDQIICSDSLDRPLYEWQVMTDQINRGHTLASDGFVYLADDTENNRVLIFEKKAGHFIHVQTLPDIGIRPHYIMYREEDRRFYVWSSMTGEMYLLKREEDSGRIYLDGIRRVDSLDGSYVRSFTIMGDDIYFVSGNSSIIRADVDTFKVREVYPVADAIAGMIQITWIDGYFYITVSTDKEGSQDAATLIRTRDLHSLAGGEYEDVYDTFVGGGTPYYISYFDSRYYLTEHRLPGHSIWSFRSEGGRLTDVTAVY